MRIAVAVAFTLVLVACSGTVSNPPIEGSTTSSGSGSSTAYQGSFPCGDTTCAVATQFCGEQTGYGPNLVTYRCLDLPAQCLTDQTCSCVIDNGGAVTVTANLE
jgi:hypothetical protein